MEPIRLILALSMHLYALKCPFVLSAWNNIDDTQRFACSFWGSYVPNQLSGFLLCRGFADTSCLFKNFRLTCVGRRCIIISQTSSNFKKEMEVPIHSVLWWSMIKKRKLRYYNFEPDRRTNSCVGDQSFVGKHTIKKHPSISHPNSHSLNRLH